MKKHSKKRSGVLINASILAILVGIFLGALVSCGSKPPTNNPTAPNDTVATAPNTNSNKIQDPVEIAVTHAYQNLRKGQIAFDAPDRMRVGDEGIVEARISDDLQRDLKAGLGKNATSAPIDVSFLMKVKLDGGSKFTIKLLSDEVQALPKGNTAKWYWNVTPTESGKQKMLLTVYAIVPIQGASEKPIFLETSTYVIDVDVNPNYWLEQNWKWAVENFSAITAAVAAFSVFVIARWKWIKGQFKKILEKTSHS